MCTAILAYKYHPNYPLIVLSNRDEFYIRPTAQAHFWEDAPHVLGGIDLEKGGTWFGINRSGNLALLTNYRDFSKHINEPLSRGLLTKSFLTQMPTTDHYLETLVKQAGLYNPYNIILGPFNDLSYYSNMVSEPKKLTPGVHGLSNGLLNDPWPKVSTALEALKIYTKHINPDDTLDEETLFSILSSEMRYPIESLPQTGISEELEVNLSSIFINLEAYGTRMQTLLYIDHLNNVTFVERSRDQGGNWREKRYAFKITNFFTPNK